MIKNITAVATTVAVLVFSGCGDDRSHPKGVDENGNPIVYANPTAVIELNATTHTYAAPTDAYTVGGGTRSTVSDPFIFTGDKSHDNDENNQSITGYAWSVSHTFIDACVDINKSNATMTFKFLHTDTNNTCLDEAINNGEINATLTVTDNEGKTASTHRNIKTN